MCADDAAASIDRPVVSDHRCSTELLGGIEGAARNGLAVMTALRLRALKARNMPLLRSRQRDSKRARVALRRYPQSH
jgi:hypothetical protein